VPNYSNVVNSYEVRHSKEESDNERACYCERVGDHTNHISDKESKEQVEQNSKVLLFANI
jgi:hypothetical protein